MAIANVDATNARDEQIIVISNGKGDNTGACGDFAYHAEVTDGYELRVVMDASTSSISIAKGSPEHFNGTVGTTPISITPTKITTAILVDNPATNAVNRTLEVSFNGGTSYFVIPRGGSLSIETEVTSFLLKSNGAGTTYQIIVTGN